MAKGAFDLNDRVMVFSLFPTSTFLCVMVKQINNKNNNEYKRIVTKRVTSG